MCIALHVAIASDLDIYFTPVSCITSEVLDPEGPDLAVAFDAITMDPVGLRYQVWLDTKKPVNLAPDVWSLKFYAQNEADLRPRVLRGSEPEKHRRQARDAPGCVMFTPAAERLVHTVRGTRRAGRVEFPPQLAEGGTKRKADEPAHIWLRRCAEAFGGIEQVALEDNLVLFMVVHLHDTKITYANLQALWAETPAARFAEGTGTEVHRYLRLDHDLEALGPLLKEPMPHVHIEADGEPRFPVPVPDCDIV